MRKMKLSTLIKRIRTSEPDSRKFTTAVEQLCQLDGDFGVKVRKITMSAKNGQQLKDQILDLIKEQ